VRFEPTDASFKAVLWILLGAVVFAAVMFPVVLWFFYDFRRYQADIKKSPFPLAAAPSTALPPEPRLEQLDRASGVETPNVYARQEAREGVLNSYGPTGEEGFVHVPIERAMRQLENKLPARAGPPPEQARRGAGLVDAGEPNSGRMFREKPRWFEP
jgi:hypothetical protein